MTKLISQTVCLGVRLTPKNIGILYQDETKKGTRLRIYLSGKFLGGVLFKNNSMTDYYLAMTRLSKKIKRPIQYIVVFYPALPLEEK